MIRNEDVAHRYVFRRSGDRRGGFRDQASGELQTSLKLPAGYSFFWSGLYESAQRVRSD